MLPRRVTKRIVNQGDAQIFGRKGASSETKDIGYVALDRRGGVEEEDLGFSLIAVQARGLCEGGEKILDSKGLSGGGAAH